MERIIQMIFRRLLNKGINSGIRAMSNRVGSNRNGSDQNSGQPSPEDRQMAQQAKQSGKNMRQASKVIRRINRF